MPHRDEWWEIRWNLHKHTPEVPAESVRRTETGSSFRETRLGATFPRAYPRTTVSSRREPGGRTHSLGTLTMTHGQGDWMVLGHTSLGRVCKPHSPDANDRVCPSNRQKGIAKRCLNSTKVAKGYAGIWAAASCNIEPFGSASNYPMFRGSEEMYVLL